MPGPGHPPPVDNLVGMAGATVIAVGQGVPLYLWMRYSWRQQHGVPEHRLDASPVFVRDELVAWLERWRARSRKGPKAKVG
jgi:hypothetical protein